MKSSKADTRSRVHKIPQIKFEKGRNLTAYAGLVVFQHLFLALQLKARLKKCFAHSDDSMFGHARIILLLIVHLLLGFRRLRGLDYYREDQIGRAHV